jgi:hypothetical protein
LPIHGIGGGIRYLKAAISDPPPKTLPTDPLAAL